ncbi:Nucleolar protein 16 [Phlyctochytrium planicorne]|nr:Nucleolar protein 16 [Phlyctochytrium planicorne]
MVRPSKRRKVKNPSQKVRRRTKNPYDISFANVPEIIRKNWDKKLTLRQNYERMGLLSELNGKAGGEAEMNRAKEKEEEENDDDWEDEDGEEGDAGITIEYRSFEEFEKMGTVTVDKPSTSSQNPLISEMELEHGIEGPLKVDSKAKIIGKKITTLLKNPEQQPIKYPVTSTKRKAAPLEEPIIETLKKKAELDLPTDRHASDNEQIHLVRLHEKYGTDYEAMARDRKLNVYQLTAGQLKRKFGRTAKTPTLPTADS